MSNIELKKKLYAIVDGCIEDFENNKHVTLEIKREKDNLSGIIKPSKIVKPVY